MISSRFGQNRKDVEPEPEASLNNAADELRKPSKSIEEEEAKKKEAIYGKPRAQEPPVNMQQYPKNAYGKTNSIVIFIEPSIKQQSIFDRGRKRNIIFKVKKKKWND